MKKYYSLDNILQYDCQYSVVIGKRSNGKSFAAFKLGLERFVKSGYHDQMAVLRRWDEDFVKNRAAQMMAGLMCDGNGVNQVEHLTGGQYNTIYYHSRRWYLAVWDSETKEIKKMDRPFAYGFSLSGMEHDKSTSFPDVKLVVFDEFITRGAYLKDEFVLYMNVLSTIIRDRNDVRILMLANTVNQYAPYFDEMGLDRIREQKPGTIEIYQMGDSSLRIAVEYCSDSDRIQKSKLASDDYFCFNNPRLKMITEGDWEIDLYPHCPLQYKSTEILYMFFIIFKADVLQAEVISHEGANFIFIHRKTSEIKKPDQDLVYSLAYDPRPNWRRRLSRPQLPVERKIWSLFLADKIYYQDNQVGEIVRNYLAVCNEE